MDTEEFKYYIDGLVEAGGIIRKVEADGEEYLHATELTETLAPEIYRLILREVDQAILSLVEKGIVRMDFDDEKGIVFSLTDLGRSLAEHLDKQRKTD